ncbi:NAD(P)-binding protein [Mycena alexandri]|uniref:NAD(P)-binding protein n=1 Tax=Mycena alexandri TaxID=1745969 RepID=A0AAD6TIL4_9AGAR|nr:NAD(P)-binding protein [Mycena alexandri]
MPIITIFGGTGCQGSAVVNSVLADGNYTPRAVSRNPESAAGQELRAKGVEVVAGNLFDRESLKDAMRGSDAVFGVTNFWDPEIYPADPKGSGEILQGQNLVDAANAVGVKFFIWSSLPNATQESKGLFPNVYHLDNEAVIEEYLKASGIPTPFFSLVGSERVCGAGTIEADPKRLQHPGCHIYGEHDQAFTWVGHDLGAAAVALLTHHTDLSKGVLGRAYPVIKMGKEVTFATVETEGIEELDVMYAYLSKFSFYPDTPVPNPDLVALGVKFGSLEEFVRSEIVPRFAYGRLSQRNEDMGYGPACVCTH